MATSPSGSESSRTATLNTIVKYYHSRESKLGYRYILGDTRHFGFYSPTLWHMVCPFPITPALRRMELSLASLLNLPRGSQVLDLGCGAARVAHTMASPAVGYRVRALDLTPHHVELGTQFIASAEAKGEIPKGAVTVERGDYHDLGTIASNSADGVYTMETLVHAVDLPKALSEIYRVTKPGGRTAHCEYEYTFPNLPMGASLMEDIYASSGMARDRPPGIWKRSFEEAGFVDVEVKDITPNVKPLGVLFFVLGIIPGIVVWLLGLQKRYPNTMSGVLVPFLWAGDHLQYVQISARKPGVLEKGKDK